MESDFPTCGASVWEDYFKNTHRSGSSWDFRHRVVWRPLFIPHSIFSIFSIWVLLAHILEASVPCTDGVGDDNDNGGKAGGSVKAGGEVVGGVQAAEGGSSGSGRTCNGGALTALLNTVKAADQQQG